MDRAFAKFAGWVVARQAAILLLVAAVVMLMAWWIYARSREMAIEQASRQQMMLAEQTARGIETYYQSIIETLDLLRRNSTDDDDATPPAPTGRGQAPAVEAIPVVLQQQPAEPRRRPSPLSRINDARDQARGQLPVGPVARQVLMPIFWEQLRDRVSHLFMLDQTTMRVQARFSDTGAMNLDKIVEARREWLAKVDSPSVSKAGDLDGKYGNLVCIPVPNGKRLICVVVPLHKIETKFLAGIIKPGETGTMLMDESGRVMFCDHQAIVGKSMLTEATDPFLVELITRTLNDTKPATAIVPNNTRLSGKPVEAGLVSVHPINIADSRWWLAVSSSLAQVEEVVQVMFRRIVAFAGVAIGVFTFAFSRIAVSQIRARAREEKVRNELLRKEVEQARKIQLAWLPADTAQVSGLDLCAVNKAANHISGDFYNWFDLPDGRKCVLIGDVTGHGMSAAFLMATTQMLLRAVMLRVQDPGRAITFVNAELTRQMFSGQFVTLLVMAIDPATGVVELATAGHPPPVVVRNGRVAMLGVEPQLVAGVERETTYPTERFQFTDETAILLYTDGIPDAASVDGSRFGDTRLVGATANDPRSSKAMIDAVLSAIDQFRRGRELDDDVTMVAVRFRAAPETSPAKRA